MTVSPPVVTNAPGSSVSNSAVSCSWCPVGRRRVTLCVHRRVSANVDGVVPASASRAELARYTACPSGSGSSIGTRHHQQRDRRPSPTTEGQHRSSAPSIASPEDRRDCAFAVGLVPAGLLRACSHSEHEWRVFTASGAERRKTASEQAREKQFRRMCYVIMQRKCSSKLRSIAGPQRNLALPDCIERTTCYCPVRKWRRTEIGPRSTAHN